MRGGGRDPTRAVAAPPDAPSAGSRACIFRGRMRIRSAGAVRAAAPLTCKGPPMASYRGHLMLSAPLGAAYGALGLMRPDPDWGPPLLAAGLTTLGGLLPDLDSDSGVPVRELFGVSAAVGAAALYPHLRHHGLPVEQSLVLVAAAYLFIRYVVSRVFRRWTVHR